MSSNFWADWPKPVIDELIRLNKEAKAVVPAQVECSYKSKESCLMCREMGHICEAIWNDYYDATMDTEEN